jgi:3-ketosteroid 9alpha-monooxygenase subunit B
MQDADAAEARPPRAERVIVIRQGHRAYRLPHHAGETLLETARRGNIALHSNCERGSCGTCIVNLLRGSVTMRHNEVLSQADVDSGLVLACQAVPTSDEVEVEPF